MNVRLTKSKGKKVQLFLLINVLLLLFLVIVFGREYVGNIQIEREIAQLQEEKALLEQDQLYTLTLIDQLSSEYYLESEARTKQGLGREGETVYVIQDSEIEALEHDLVRQQQLNSYSNPERWFLYFFDPTMFQLLQNEEG